jgi:Leucine-rich repeat (LRR) protein
LDNTQLQNISALQGMRNLTQLNLGDNQITDISALQGLRNLTYLYLMQNQITQLPASLVELNLEIDVDADRASSADRKIFLGENPLEKPPLEIIRKGKQAIKAYFDSLTGRGLTMEKQRRRSCGWPSAIFKNARSAQLSLLFFSSSPLLFFLFRPLFCPKHEIRNSKSRCSKQIQMTRKIINY